MKALPSMIILYGIPYSVELTPDLASDANEFGELSFLRHRIKIEASLDLPTQWVTLCHEILHAIDFAQNLELSEATIHRLDSGLWEFIQQIT